MKKHIQIKNSYCVWNPQVMKYFIERHCQIQDSQLFALTLEWWLHNIGYYITLPFITNDWCASINRRCKDVDLLLRVLP